MTLLPQFPIYIPSKSRAAIGTTPGVLDRLGVPYRIVVEEQQFEEYSRYHDPTRLLILDPVYKRDYDACMDLEEGQSKGSGPARNFIWDHAVGEGHAWHWTMDDNITLFARLHQNQRIPVGDAMIFAAMEEFVLRYRNVAMAGPDYWMFAPSRAAAEPFVLNTRIFSCNLIRNDVGLRWRARYNEDLDLSIRMLKAGWCTVLFKAFLQYKVTTQSLPGGNMEAFYAAEGTTKKSEMIVRLHPDVCRLATRYGRDHHHADLSRWKSRRLVRRTEEKLDDSAEKYAAEVVAAGDAWWRPGPDAGRRGRPRELRVPEKYAAEIVPVPADTPWKKGDSDTPLYRAPND